MAHVPVFAKLPAAAPDVVGSRAACVRAGAHGLTLIDSLPASASTPRRCGRARRRSTGWLSGPAIRPLALRAVFEVASALPDVPIVARGRRALR